MEKLSSDSNSDNDKNRHKDQSQFKEEDNSSDSGSFQELRTAKQGKLLQAIQLKNPDLTTQMIDFSLPSRFAEYSLIRVPKNINPSTLQNLKCSFDKSILNNKQFLFQPLTKKPKTIFINLNGSKLVTLNKIIVLQKTPPLLPLNEIKSFKRENISLPSAVKTRHPLFGVTYDFNINIKKRIKKKILEAIEKKVHVEKKERTRKHKRREGRHNNLVNDEKKVLGLLNFNSLRKKSR